MNSIKSRLQRLEASKPAQATTPPAKVVPPGFYAEFEAALGEVLSTLSEAQQAAIAQQTERALQAFKS